MFGSLHRCTQSEGLIEKLPGLVGAFQFTLDDRSVGVSINCSRGLGALHERQQLLVVRVEALPQRREVVLHAEQLLRVADRPVIEVSLEGTGTLSQRIDSRLQRRELCLHVGPLATPAPGFTAAAIQLGIGGDPGFDIHQAAAVVVQARIDLLQPEQIATAAHVPTPTRRAV